MKFFEEIKGIEDPVKKRAMFSAILSKEIMDRGGRPPILVGGIALEIYTQGSYTTGDIDLKADRGLLEIILTQWNFKKSGRLWFNSELDIYIDWLGEGLDEGKEAEVRVNTVIVGKNLEVRVISIEDLIIDRLNAAKWWDDKDSLMWSIVLVSVKRELGEVLDLEYLRKRAKAEDLEDLLNKILEGSGI